MSLLQTIDPARLGTPVRAKAAPDRLIAGDPDFLTWALDSSRDGEVRTGIWEATPGETLSIKGDSFIMKPGYRGAWKTIETVRKIYVIVG